MKTHEANLENIYQYLVEQQLDGLKFVAYIDGETVTDREQLTCLSSAFDAMTFCYENTTDIDRYSFMDIRTITKAVSNEISTGSYSQGEDRLIDIEKLVADYRCLLEQQQIINYPEKINDMNQKNFEYLRDQVKYTGFGEALESELKEKLEKQTPAFAITHNAKFGNDDISAVLHFKKSDQTDNYFFNSYDLSVKQKQESEIVNQTFYIGKENNYTLKEGYNLLCGRAVHKELNKLEKVGEGENARFKPTDETYNAWVQLDFKNTDNQGNYKHKQFSENYGYDLNEALAKHPIQELANEQDKERLIESLKKGNRQAVTFEQDGNETKQFIEANPQFKSITIYDTNMQRVNTRQKQGEEQQDQQNNTKQASKSKAKNQGASDDGNEVSEESNTKRKRKNQSIN